MLGNARLGQASFHVVECGMTVYQTDMPAYRLLRACYENPNQVGYHEICHFLSTQPHEKLMADVVAWGGLVEQLVRHMDSNEAIGLGAMECLGAYLDAAAGYLEAMQIPSAYTSSSSFGVVYDTLMDILRKMRSSTWQATPLLHGMIAHKLWTPERLMAVFNTENESGFKKQAFKELTVIAIPLLLDTDWIPCNTSLLNEVWDVYEPHLQHTGGAGRQFFENIPVLLNKLPVTLPGVWVSVSKNLRRQPWCREALDYYFPMPLQACPAGAFVRAFAQAHTQAWPEDRANLMALLHTHHPEVAQLFEMHFNMMSLVCDDYTYLEQGFRLYRGEQVEGQQTILNVGHLFEDI